MVPLRAFVFIVLLAYPVLSSYVLDDFENGNTDKWTGLKISSSIKHSGQYSGCWTNTSSPTSIKLNLDNATHDWSKYTLFSMWVYNEKADNSGLQLVLLSENSSTSGDDYYSFEIVMDWKGWKHYTKIIPSGFSTSRSPLGWDKIQTFRLYSSGWSHTPTGVMVCLDDITLDYAVPTFVEKVNLSGALVPGFETQFYVPIIGLKNGNKDTLLTAKITQGNDYIASAKWTDTSKSITESRLLKLKNDEYIFPVASLTPNDAASKVKGKPLEIVFCLTLADLSGNNTECWSFVGKVNPDPAKPLKSHPYIWISADDIEKYKKERDSKPWIDRQLTTMTNYLNGYGNKNMEFPEGISRWTGYYVCADGTGLTFNETEPKKQYCPSDKKYYTGEPYDGAWIAKKHGSICSAVNYLAFSYLVNKTEKAFGIIRDFFMVYTKKYLTLPYHGTDGSDNYFATSGARLMPQTLDESSLAIEIAFAYDVIYNNLTREERTYIEYNFLQPLYYTIYRYNAGTSNWQSWHNAGMTAIGAVLNNKEMVSHAIDGEKNGFKFQMNSSVEDDGIWYEQSMGYHYYSLNALQKNAILAKVMGYDLFHYTTPWSSNPKKFKGVKDMYMGPIHLMMPNFHVPAINDGGEESLSGYANYYEVANSMYPEEKDIIGWALCTFLANTTRRSLEAMMFGEELPDWCKATGPVGMKSPLKSEYLEASGAAILRSDENYLFYENGPHGGWHGHYDKLALIFYTHGKELIRDYGSLAYRLPMHNNYFKRTLSHSAPMLDGICQTESRVCGPALVDGSLGDVQFSKLTTDSLNDGNKFQRTIFFITHDQEPNEYPLMLDVTEAIIEKENETGLHFYDVITHSESTQYSLSDSDGKDVAMSSVTESMGDDVAWQYLKNLKKTESKEYLHGVWDWGHTVRHQFDRKDEWTKLELTQEHVQTGKYSMRWQNHVQLTGTSTTKFMRDWSNVAYMTLNLYNVVPNTEKLYLIVKSENASTSGEDYYSKIIPLNWTGWSKFNWTRDEFNRHRSPIGWNSINGLQFSASWGSSQCENSDLFFDSFMFFDKNGKEIDSTEGLEQFLPKVSYDRKTFVDKTAPSIPTSYNHSVTIVRQNAKNPSIQLLRPYTGTDFVTSFTATGKKQAVVKTKIETITVTLGNLSSETPCSLVERRPRNGNTVISHIACTNVTLSHSDMNLSVSLFRRDISPMTMQRFSSSPIYNPDSKSIIFEGVKLPGGVDIGVQVKSCTNVEGLTLYINDRYASVVEGKTYVDGCVVKVFSYSSTVDDNEYKNLTVVLRDEKNPNTAGHLGTSLVLALLFIVLVFSL